MRSIENEYHFLMICPHYVDIRRKYLQAYYCNYQIQNYHANKIEEIDK